MLMATTGGLGGAGVCVGLGRTDGAGAKTAVTFLCAFMLMTTGFWAPLASPPHELNCHPEAALAVRVTDAPQGWVPPLGLTLPAPEGLTLVIRITGRREKLAIMLLLPSMVMVMGFWVPLASPDQPLNSQPELAVAKMVADVLTV